MLKKILFGLAVAVGVAAAGVFVFVRMKVTAFDRSMAKVYEVPLPQVARSTDAAAIERGKHLAESLGGCQGCHGANYAGGKLEDMGPVGRFRAGNLTSGKNGSGSGYSDAELARLILHGVKRNGTSARMMPSPDYAWWPDDDVAALISYLRTLPPVDAEPAMFEVGLLGKVLDQLELMRLDVARRIAHAHRPVAPVPSPTREYGVFVAQICTGCHGTHLSGGKLPGTPPEIPIPSNLTPHATGTAGWSFEDFERVLRQGIRKDGQKLNPFMPVEATKNLNDTEMRALWAYLQSTPATPFGNR